MTQAKQTTDWFEQGKQYWDGWLDAQRKVMEEQTKTFAGMQGNWNELFQNWQSMTSAKTDGAAGANAFRDLFTKTGENFMSMMEQFYQSAGQQKTPEDATREWMNQMQRFFENMLRTNGQPYDATAQYKSFMDSMAHGGPAFWTNAFKNPFMNQKQDFQTANLFDPFGFYASMPGIGYTREKQEHLNKLYRLFVDYEGKMRVYNNEMTKVGLQALQRFGEYLQNPPADAPKLESLKSIYAKWVDVCEEIYAKYAYSEEYAKVYGDVVNALMEYKKQMHLIADDMVEQMNLPTRAEVDSLHQRVQELRRDNIRLQKALEELLGDKAPTAKKAKGKKK